MPIYIVFATIFAALSVASAVMLYVLALTQYQLMKLKRKLQTSEDELREAIEKHHELNIDLLKRGQGDNYLAAWDKVLKD